MLRILISIVLAYFIGNIQSALIISKGLLKKDVRESGSGSAGASNMFRTFGPKYGVLTLFCDFLKAYIAFWLCYAIGGEKLNVWCSVFGGLFVVIGHDWPVLYHFKGGKGIAATLGVVTALNPLVALLGLAVAVVAAFITGLMSVGSLAGVVIVLIYAIFVKPWPYKVLLLLLALLDVWQHRGNIQRLIRGEENPLFEGALKDRFKKRSKRNLK